MSALIDLGRFETLGVTLAMFALVAFGFLTGKIRMDGLLNNKVTGEFDPARLQLLVSTLLFAGLTLTRIGEMRSTGVVALPSSALLLLFGGSQAIYLVRKSFQLHLFG